MGIKSVQIESYRLNFNDKSETAWCIIKNSIIGAWAAGLWTLLIFKWVSDGASTYSFLTNWSLTINAIFYVFDLICAVGNFGGLTFYTYTVGLWITNGFTWCVFWLVWIAIADNPGLIESQMEQFGGKYSAGLVINMNTVEHYLPAPMILFLFACRRKVISACFFALKTVFTRYAASKDDELVLSSPSSGTLISGGTNESYSRQIQTDTKIYMILYVIIVSLVLPAIVGLVYRSVNDPIHVYGLTTNIAWIALTMVAALVVHNFLLCLYVALNAKAKVAVKSSTLDAKYQQQPLEVAYQTHASVDGENYIQHRYETQR